MSRADVAVATADYLAYVDEAMAAPLPIDPRPESAFTRFAAELTARGERLVDGTEVAGEASAICWLVEAAEQVHHGGPGPRFNLDPGPGRVDRYFHSGLALHPEDGQPILDARGHPISSRRVAEAMIERHGGVMLEQLPDAELVDDLRLWTAPAKRHIAELAATDSRLARRLGDICPSKVVDDRLARTVWLALSTQYARDTRSAALADPEVGVAVVTNQLRPDSLFCAHEYPILVRGSHDCRDGIGDRVLFTAQLLTSDGEYAPTGGAISGAELTRRGRGVPHAEPGAVGPALVERYRNRRFDEVLPPGTSRLVAEELAAAAVHGVRPRTGAHRHRGRPGLGL